MAKFRTNLVTLTPAHWCFQPKYDPIVDSEKLIVNQSTAYVIFLLTELSWATKTYFSTFSLKTNFHSIVLEWNNYQLGNNQITVNVMEDILDWIIIYLFGWFQPSQTGGQPYTDASPTIDFYCWN